MCYSPITINNKSSYIVDRVSFYSYTVPCGKCLECRSAKVSEWQTRISFELDALYKRGGKAVFLTLTYNSLHLPHVTLSTSDETQTIECFDRDHVLQFLNVVKVYMNKKYGKLSYKYFLTCEYGGITTRPHYHVIFFLQSQVNWFKFVEKCREKWSYGFLFPKYDARLSCYVDSHNQPAEPPTIKNLQGCAKYVSKYITKDMDFFGLPIVEKYINENPRYRSFIAKYLPKHWQSNKLGISIMDHLQLMNNTSLENILSRGVLNPVTFKYVPLPQFILNKIMYINVKSDRIGKNGKPLYDRYLSDYGREYFEQVFNARLTRTCLKMSTLFQTLPPCLGFAINNLGNFIPVALYKMVWQSTPWPALNDILSKNFGDISAFSDPKLAFKYWLLNKDTAYLKSHKSDHSAISLRNAFLHGDLSPALSALIDRLSTVFEPLNDILTIYEYTSRENAKNNAIEYKRQQDELHRLKRKYKSRYNKHLC